MKKIAAALAAFVALSVVTGSLLFYSGPNRESRAKDGTSRNASSTRGTSRPDEAASRSKDESDIAELARQKSLSSREQLIALYVAWAGKPDRVQARRAIVREILAADEPTIALQLIVTAVSRDPTPYRSDELLGPVARDLTVIWKDVSLYTKGIDLMRLTDDMKAQAVLAESLTLRFTSPPSGMESVETQRYALVSDLSYLYRTGAQDADFKTQLLRNIQDVGGSEMAELAVNPGNPNAAYYKRMEAERTQAINTVPPAP